MEIGEKIFGNDSTIYYSINYNIYISSRFQYQTYILFFGIWKIDNTTTIIFVDLLVKYFIFYLNF